MCKTLDILREFVEDVKLAYGTGEGFTIDDDMMDWPDLSVTYRKAVKRIMMEDRKED